MRDRQPHGRCSYALRTGTLVRTVPDYHKYMAHLCQPPTMLLLLLVPALAPLPQTLTLPFAVSAPRLPVCPVIVIVIVVVTVIVFLVQLRHSQQEARREHVLQAPRVQGPAALPHEAPQTMALPYETPHATLGTLQDMAVCESAAVCAHGTCNDLLSAAAQLSSAGHLPRGASARDRRRCRCAHALPGAPVLSANPRPSAPCPSQSAPCPPPPPPAPARSPPSAPAPWG